MKAPLSKYDAFPDESFLGTLKKLIRTPNKPLSHVANRLKELQSGPSMRITKNVLFGTPILKNQFAASANPSQSPSTDEILEIRFKNSTLRSVHPDNVIRLQNGKFLEIARMFKENEDLKIEGYFIKSEDAFEYPCPSNQVAVVKMIRRSTNIHTIYGNQISHKCVKSNLGSKIYISTLLHG
ncbi:hypothetical protein QAD02_008473 [Eretmocerus hayati]|uniref:Uncharacterized protein n=1 Tax=Eretmocerus hayati TaxID=131215 RepID=A0ACC2N7E4_9HYME|nr:hypothetical protein QAD02_008473 [Eretmocerus hayati]